MKHLIALSIVTLMGLASSSNAAISYVISNVQRTLIADQGRWGGCMIYLDETLADHGLDCPSHWVSFSCTGKFTTKDVAYRMFDSAQMAYALRKRVVVQVDDTKKHNGYCYGSRVDVLP
jgi:hypothetical protein